VKILQVVRLITAMVAVGALTQNALSQPKITAVVNAASFLPGLPGGGSLATIFCSGVVGVKPGTYVASGSPLPYVLGGLSVTINTGLAPMLAVVIDSSGNAQVNFQMPMERDVSFYPTAGQYTGDLTACGGAVMTQFPVPSEWGAFFADANGYAIAQHASDYSLVTPQNPAHPGETLVVYADDFFPVWPPPPIGFQTPSEPLFQILPPSQVYFPYQVGSRFAYLYLQTYPQPICMIGGGCNNSFANTPALTVTFEGLASGQIGVEQINFVVPSDQQPGDWALFFNLGSCPDGSGPPGRCGPGYGSSSPYVKLPVR